MTDTTDVEAPTFGDLGLRPELLKALGNLGYTTPTPIQAKAIQPLVAGNDVLGQARTGTGKTAAFSLPLLHHLDQSPGVQAIILAPTRELAIQVADAIRGYGKHIGPRGVQVLPVYGGQPIYVQLKALKRGVQVVVGTPGRVKDHLERKTLDLSSVRFFGLDEADEMLKMGFIDDVEWILEHAPKTRQVAVFSATLPPRIRSIAERYQNDPVDVSVAQPSLTVPAIDQYSLFVRGFHDKDHAVERILQTEEHEAILIFAGTRQACEDLTNRLNGRGQVVEAVHGGMSQPQREAVLRRLREKRTKVVVATDVAARGLDVDHISLVINYDLPRDREVYVHRIGRTGRAGRSGRSISFFRSRERYQLKGIERMSGKPMTPLRLPTDREMTERKREKLKEQIRATALELDPAFTKLVAELEADGMEPAQIAAAAARLFWGAEPLELPKVVDRRRERAVRRSHADHEQALQGKTHKDRHKHREGGKKRWENPHGKAVQTGPAPAGVTWENQHGTAPQSEAPAGAAPQAELTWENQHGNGPVADDRHYGREMKNLARREGPPKRRAEPRDPGPLSGDEVELVLPVGKLNRLRPGDVVGAIANETGLSGKVVGAIRILDRVTFVAVAREHSDAILAALTGVTICRRQIQPRLAHPEQSDEPRRPSKHRGPRSSSEDHRVELAHNRV